MGRKEDGHVGEVWVILAVWVCVDDPKMRRKREKKEVVDIDDEIVCQ